MPTYRPARGIFGVLIMLKNNLQFPSLEAVTRPTVTTEECAYFLNRRPQTLRSWASTEHGPIRPVRINGRLAWPVASIRKLLSGGV